MNEQDKKSPQSKKHSHRMTAVYLVLLIVGILSAWQIHILINSGGDKTTDLPAPERSWSPRIVSLPSSRPSSMPAALGAMTETGAGLVEMDSDPGGVNPPDTAVCRWAARRQWDVGFEEMGRYDYEGSLADVAGHYKKLLADMGYELMEPSQGGDEQGDLIFIKGQKQVSVSLRKGRRDAKIVIITVTVTQWRQ